MQTASEQKIFKKNAGPGEIAIYEILDQVADRYNPNFSRLCLPKAVEIDYKNGIISIPFYDGQTFNELWNEATGGSLLGLDLSKEAAEIMNDLAKIEIDPIINNQKLKNVPNVFFNHSAYLQDFAKLLDQFVNAKIITAGEKAQAETLLKEPFRSKLIFNNGDFYARNFIRLADGKIVLIDWETWNAHSRAHTIDHIENVAAYFFVSMWENQAWQLNFVRELRKFFPVRPADLQKAILINSAEMAMFWFNNDGQNKLCANQIAIFKKALNQDYILAL